MDIYFAGQKFRAQSKFANIAKISSTRKIRVIQYLGPLKSTHEEDDTGLVLHAVHSQFHTVVMSSRDTDVLLLLVSHFQSMQCIHVCQPREKFSRDKRRPVERSEADFGRGAPGFLPRKFSKTCITNGAIRVIPELYVSIQLAYIVIKFASKLSF